MKIVITLTQEGANKITGYIDDNYEFFPQELEGPIAPKTYRAERKFWTKALGAIATKVPKRYIKDAYAIP